MLFSAAAVALTVFLAWWYWVKRPALQRQAQAALQSIPDQAALRKLRVRKFGFDGQAAPQVGEPVRLPPRKWGPVTSPEALLEWEEPAVLQELGPAAPKAKRTDSGAGARHYMLACHDMAGNYAQDAWVDGWYPGAAATDEDWAYAFRPTHLAMLDVFVYFSHSLVSIPPRGWIEAAHRHGCAVYGTLLTEWAAGSQFCAVLFQPDVYPLVAAQLERIRRAHGFDGWLVNVENPVAKDRVGCVLGLLAMMRANSPVVWYDSILTSGALEWQNGLDADNLAFFQQASQMFTNYQWNAALLARTNALAQARKADVLHGIDVFGRQTIGGGGFNCAEPLGLLDANACPSAAIFAPGWTLEVAAERDAAKAGACEAKFWTGIAKAGWGSQPRRVVVHSPFFTDFCDGGGRAGLFVQGAKVSSAPWMDLRRQTLQPAWDALGEPGPDLVVCRYQDSGQVFSGGGCVQVVGRTPPTARAAAAGGGDAAGLPLLSLEMRLGGAPHSMLEICAAVNVTHGDCGLYVDIESRAGGGKADEESAAVSRLHLLPGEQFRSTDRALASRGPDQVLAGGWRLRRWVLKTGALRGRRIVALGVLPVSAGWVDVRLGLVGLRESEHRPGAVARPRLRAAEGEVRWECSRHGAGAPPCGCWAFCHVFAGPRFLCTGFGTSARLCETSEDAAWRRSLLLKVVGWEGLIVQELGAFLDA
jgi:hypothetical protein